MGAKSVGDPHPAGGTSKVFCLSTARHEGIHLFRSLKKL